MIVRIYLIRNPYYGRFKGEPKWEGWSVERCLWAGKASKINVVKALCTMIKKSSLRRKIREVNGDYTPSMNLNAKTEYKQAIPWRTFQFYGITAKVRILKKRSVE